MLHGQAGWTGTGAGIGTYMATQTNEAWCACGCLLTGPAGGGTSGTSYTVATGQSVVLVDPDKVVRNSKDYVCIRKKRWQHTQVIKH